MTFTSPKTLLRRLGLRARKAWGQHFLLYPHQAQRIVAALALSGEETVVEIGPGLGALTVFLAQEAGKVVALERDPALARFLETELFPQNPRVQILCQDALALDLAACSREAGRPLAVAGNLPYQITSPLLFKLAEEKAAVSRAVLMMQQEVGVRLSAAPGTKDYGILSVLIQYHFSLERLFSLGPANFYPPPQVDSVVLRLAPREPVPPARDEALLTRVVKAAFAHRRKTLNNTLVNRASAFGLSPETMRAIFQTLAIDPGRRGETLAVAQFVALSNAIREAGLLK
ncbi:MAG: 16S rRNA (adenine(1518)-N(6)/adenine(1519)-N(6))-dimethyltransferase RsmA [Syntrophales bacterium]|nr:16S rRNA (adenine(1518)-N(6)/adenine(1519)-N(6))-dimethyltransferase RsmA [Syntrophales bacterium]MDD5641338.1 16S rRNA (adenine(1518)-N(6)/adenine(1519)-N(6))-dimethyltransferase RsmA [Syntrophales bacterium]